MKILTSQINILCWKQLLGLTLVSFFLNENIRNNIYENKTSKDGTAKIEFTNVRLYSNFFFSIISYFCLFVLLFLFISGGVWLSLLMVDGLVKVPLPTKLSIIAVRSIIAFFVFVYWIIQ